ncbi:MAG: Maf family protein [Spirochaetales bacterium]|nr:Maf family protein [Spirochaetales bacterium]
MNEIILASASPRRQELVKQMGLNCIILPQNVDETFESYNAEEEAVRIAQKKAESCKISDRWVFAADTFIEQDGKLIGKPSNREEAKIMLQNFSGCTHSVITGLALKAPLRTIQTAICRTDVIFTEMTNDEIDWYLNTEEWKGVAGAYRIQGKGAFFIESLKGSYSNVMGLPIRTFYGMLKSNNFNFRS